MFVTINAKIQDTTKPSVQEFISQRFTLFDLYSKCCDVVLYYRLALNTVTINNAILVIPLPLRREKESRF